MNTSGNGSRIGLVKAGIGPGWICWQTEKAKVNRSGSASDGLDDDREGQLTMCHCIEQINSKLKDKNLEITQMFLVNETFGLSPVLIQVNKINPKKRGGSPPMQAVYCPFCGVKYTISAAEQS